MGEKSKRPTSKYRPKPSKVPTSEPVSTSRDTVHWSFALFDGSIEWHTHGYKEETFRQVAEHMRGYEGMTWGEIENKRKHNHPVPVGGLIPRAQARLREINQDDIDELWRFRFGGQLRIWGIRDGRLFKVLWWDPQHAICPSAKKHT